MSERRSSIIALALLVVVPLVMFADVLFSGGTYVPGHRASDLFLQYFAWRQFGFQELAKGNLALWNPHIFSGAPYFGGMQGALLYPPNWIFLVLSTPVAICWSVVLHVFGIGALMFYWMRQRALGVAASFFGAVIMMFCGAFFSHVFAGHLAQMSTMIWSPLIFGSIDGLFRTRRVHSALLGIFAVGMQLLAGFPQYVFYTGLIAATYCALRLINQWHWRLAAGLTSIYPGGALLACAQLLPAIETTHETTRGLRLPFKFASMVAFPPENFVTLLAPRFLGGIAQYWGRWYLWETSLFVGIVGLSFAVYAIIVCEWRLKWPLLTVLFISLVLALGVYTPLFRFLYNWAPGFDRFRSISKFIFLASLFLALLAATGLDRLFRQRKVEVGFIAAVFAGAVGLGIAAGWTASTKSWSALMNALGVTGESYLAPQLYASDSFVTQAQHQASSSLVLSAAVCALLGIILMGGRRDPRVLYIVIALGLTEMFVFGYQNGARSDSAEIVNANEKRFLDEHPGDYRIMNVGNPNTAMMIGAQDLWGYDATVVRRYAEFMTWSQGGDPNAAMSYVKFVQYDPLFTMLRHRYVFAQRGAEFEQAEATVPPMPHLQLVSKYRVLPNRDAIFEALRAPTFDPADQVILESEPEPAPVAAGDKGTAEIIASSTDWMTIEANVTEPSVLLITDAYTSSWRAVPLTGSVQSKYQLLPANYILRAIPLSAGHHSLRVEYASRALAIGKWISIGAVGLFVFGLGRFRNHQLLR